MKTMLQSIRIIPSATAAIFWLALAASALCQTTGSLTGQVSNAATNSFLQDAVVNIPALGRQAMTDNAGSFTFIDLPPGDYAVEVSYLGLDTARQTVHIAAGQRASRNFELRSEVYRLEAFVVTGEREGNAAAITRQRFAPNVKNVVAVDAFGNMPNENGGELLARLPGIASRLDGEGNVTGVMIRGTAVALNTISIDGNMQASTGGMSRDFRTNDISSGLFDEIEVNKAPTPDMSADSLGGAVDFKTRSPLGMKEKRRISYRASVRWAPPFYDQIPERRDHPLHPLLSLGYQEVFSVFGGERNLGVAVNAFYSENVAGGFTSIQDYQYTTASPAYVWDYRTQDAYNNRKQTSADVKVEYRLSPRTRFFFNTIYNDAFEPYNRIFLTRAFCGRTVGTTGTSAILPTYTNDITEVRPVASADFQLNSTLYGFMARYRQFNLGAKHEFDRWRLSYDAVYNYCHVNLEDGGMKPKVGGGIFTMDVPSVGWILDKTKSDLYPTFTQTAGPSIYDLANYRNALLVTRDGGQRNTAFPFTASVNASYALPTSFALSLKAGARYRSQRFNLMSNAHQWSFGGTALPASLVDPSVTTTDELRTGKELPFLDSASVAANIRDNPSLWKENLYADESAKFTGNSKVSEDITASYLQTQARLGRLGILAGVRVERTEVYSFGYVAAHVLSTTAQRTADPIGYARADYDHPQSTKGKYTKFFPGVHLTYKFTPNFQARASWSNSIGRPAASNLVPSWTANDTAQTLSVNNPSLKPQHSENWDAGLEYYFEPVGQLSGGFFRKTIKDYIVTSAGGVVGSGSDNGYNGEYAGFTLMSQFNAGSAVIEGWELNYQQQFTFLPGALKGLGAFANFTKLRTHGDYGGTTNLSTNQVAGFIPETGNAGLSFKHRKFGSRVLVNYMGPYLANYSTDASRLQYRFKRTAVNLNLTFQLRPQVSLSCDIANLFNEPQQMYRYSSDHLSSTIISYTAITFGVNGRF